MVFEILRTHLILVGQNSFYKVFNQTFESKFCPIRYTKTGPYIIAIVKHVTGSRHLKKIIKLENGKSFLPTQFVSSDQGYGKNLRVFEKKG